MAFFEGLPIRKHLLSIKNKAAQLSFAKVHLNLPEQCPLDRWDQSGAVLPWCTCATKHGISAQTTVEHRGGRVMILACFAAKGSGQLADRELLWYQSIIKLETMEWMQKNKIKNSHGCRFGFYGASFSKVSVLMYTLKRWIKKIIKYLHQNFERCPPQETGFTGSEAASSLTNVALPGTVLKVLLFSQLTKWMLAWGWDPIWTTIVVKAGSFLHSFMWGSVKRVRHSILIITTTSHVCLVTMRKKNSGDAVLNISCCENTSTNRADYKRNVAIWRFQLQQLQFNCNCCNWNHLNVLNVFMVRFLFVQFSNLT